MFNYRLLSHFLRPVKQASSIDVLQNLRWTSTLAVDFDDAALAAAKPYEEIPSLLILPLVGTGWAFFPIIGRYDITKFHISLREKRKLLGDIYREKLGPYNMVVSFNADDLKAMYEHEGKYPLRIELESVKKYRESRKESYPTSGLTIVHGKEWWDYRVRVQKHLMKPKAIEAFLFPMQDVARDLVQKIKDVKDAKNEVDNFMEELNKWSLESIALVSLDTRLGCLQRGLSPDSDGMKLITSVQKGFRLINELEAFSGKLQLWKYFPTKTYKEFEKASDTFTEVTMRLIKQSLEKLRKAPEDQDATLLQSLLMEKDLDASSVMVMVNDMLLAGIDTTSITVGFFLYAIAKNPDKQEVLYQELKKVLPHKDDKITPGVYNELRYLKACIKESQRLNPVAGLQSRTFDHDVILSGYRIPQGTVLLVGIQEIFLDEKYFSNPNAFIPERWLQKDDKFNPWTFLPFSFGVRSCVGRRLAELEINCLAAEIIRNFKVEYHYEDIGITTRLVNTPDKPLRFNFIER